jgi:hypothetical protein
MQRARAKERREKEQERVTAVCEKLNPDHVLLSFNL